MALSRGLFDIPLIFLQYDESSCFLTFSAYACKFGNCFSNWYILKPNKSFNTSVVLGCLLLLQNIDYQRMWKERLRMSKSPLSCSRESSTRLSCCDIVIATYKSGPEGQFFVITFKPLHVSEPVDRKNEYWILPGGHLEASRTVAEVCEYQECVIRENGRWNKSFVSFNKICSLL